MAPTFVMQEVGSLSAQGSVYRGFKVQISCSKEGTSNSLVGTLLL